LFFAIFGDYLFYFRPLWAFIYLFFVAARDYLFYFRRAWPFIYFIIRHSGIIYLFFAAAGSYLFLFRLGVANYLFYFVAPWSYLFYFAWAPREYLRGPFFLNLCLPAPPRAFPRIFRALRWRWGRRWGGDTEAYMGSGRVSRARPGAPARARYPSKR
jgi:hypothetical protein